MEMNKDLKFIRLTAPGQFNLIPPYLFEQVKGRRWDVQRLRNIGPILLTSPFNIIGVFSDADNKIKGFLWVVLDILNETLEVVLLSVDRKYQNNGILAGTLELVKTFPERPDTKNTIQELNINLKDKIYLTTTRPHALEKAGCKRSNIIIMEINR